MSEFMAPEEFLEHYGVKGMKWGVRRSDAQLNKARSGSDNKLDRSEKKAYGAEFNEIFSRRWDRSLGIEPKMKYDELSTKTTTINKGSDLYRVVGKKNLDAPATYVSTNQQDRNTYKIAMGTPGFGVKRYEKVLKATENLKSPSEKERMDAFISILDARSVTLKNGKQVTGREYLKRQGFKKEVKTLETQELGLSTYNRMAEMQWMRNPLNDAYYNEVRSRGYNALIDDNDRAIVSNAPLIVLNPDKSVKQISVRQLDKYDINEAKRNLKAPDPRERR